MLSDTSHVWEHTHTNTQPTWRTDISHLRSVLDPRHDRRQTTTTSSGEDRARARCWREMLATTPSPPTFDTARPSGHCVAGRSTAWVSPCSLTCVTCHLCRLSPVSPVATRCASRCGCEWRRCGGSSDRPTLHNWSSLIFFLSLASCFACPTFIPGLSVCGLTVAGRWCGALVQSVPLACLSRDRYSSEVLVSSEVPPPSFRHRNV